MYIEPYMCWVWGVIFLIFLAIESLTKDKVVLFYALVTLIPLILSLCFDIAYWIEIIVFAVLCLVVFIFIYFLEKKLNKDYSIINKRVLVVDDITKDKIGKVKLGNEILDALSLDNVDIYKFEYSIIVDKLEDKVIVKKESD